MPSLVGSEMCIRDRLGTDSLGRWAWHGGGGEGGERGEPARQQQQQQQQQQRSSRKRSDGIWDGAPTFPFDPGKTAVTTAAAAAAAAAASSWMGFVMEHQLSRLIRGKCGGQRHVGVSICFVLVCVFVFSRSDTVIDIFI